MKRVCYGLRVLLIIALIFAGPVFAESAPNRSKSFNVALGIADTKGKHSSIFGTLYTLGVQIAIPVGKVLAIRPELHLGLSEFGFLLPAMLLDYNFKDSFVGAGIAFPSVIQHSGFGSLSPAGKLHAGYRTGRWVLSAYWLTTSFSHVHYGLIGATMGYYF